MDISTAPIAISMRDGIEETRRRFGHTLASHSFNCLYLWREQMGLSVHIGADIFAVRSASRGGNCWFFPCGSESAKREFIEAGMRSPDFSLCYMGADDVRFLEDGFPSAFRFEREEGSDEYICSTEKLLSMSGGEFARMRQRLHRIERRHSVCPCPITDENAEEARLLIDRWSEESRNNDGQPLSDDGVSAAAIAERKALGLSGIILYIDGAPSAVVAGAPLTADTLGILVGKNLYTAPRGSLNLAIHEYLKLFGQSYPFCNVEEDLGIEGIRRQKEELRPVFKNHIWNGNLI